MCAHALRAAPETRAAKLDQRLRELAGSRGVAGDECYGAIVGLVADAVLERDAETLATALHGLQRVHARHERAECSAATKLEVRGRLLTLLDLVTWTLRRSAVAATP